VLNEDKIRRRLPPYISYRTFQTFVDRLHQTMPARIDRSYWGKSFSGSTGNQLMSALLFLALVDGTGAPTNRLKLLVGGAKDVKSTDIIKQTCMDAFDFLFVGSFDLQTATAAQMQKLFHSNFQISSSVCRKCIKFFVDMASDADIPLSPYITKQIRNTHSTGGSKAVAKKSTPRIGQNLYLAQETEDIPGSLTWDKMLLNKFPSFDPTWPDEVKLQWFRAFDELLRRGLTKTEM
jgi:hypothetical protein